MERNGQQQRTTTSLPFFVNGRPSEVNLRPNPGRGIANFQPGTPISMRAAGHGAREGASAWDLVTGAPATITAPELPSEDLSSPGLASAAIILSCGSAQAQGFFEALFGRRWSGPHAYADPNSQAPEAARPEATGSVYCVRLCDGRLFPIQRHGGVSPAQACSSFCPASATKIYNGSSIDHAMAIDGSATPSSPPLRLSRQDRPRLHLQRQERVRPGQYAGGRGSDPSPGRHRCDQRRAHGLQWRPPAQAFTPIASYAGLSADLRRQLTETRIAPATDLPFRRRPCGRRGRRRSAPARTSGFRPKDSPRPRRRSRARR